MKTLVVFSMAIVASQAFFLPNDFFTDIAHRMTDLHHAVRPQGQFSHRPHPPLLPDVAPDATNQRMSDLFDSLTPEEQAALKNHLFGQRFPRPLPASHHGEHPKFTDEQMEAARAKWNSMTPEQQQAFREKHQKPHHFRSSDSSESSSSEGSSSEEIRVRRPRSIQARPLPDFEAPVVRPAHHNSNHKKTGDEKLRAIQERWEAMTPAEREAVKNGRRKHYKSDEIPLARPNPQNPDKPLVRSPRTFQAIRPLPEYFDTPMVRNPRSIQAIQPLPEFTQFEPASSQGQLNPGDHRRPVYPGGNQRPNFPEGAPKPNPRPLIGESPNYVPIRPFNVALNPESDYTVMLEILKGMTEEEQIKFIRGLYPEGLPIRPIDQGIDSEYSRRPFIPIEPAGNAEKLIKPIRGQPHPIDHNNFIIDPEYSRRPIEPAVNEMKIQPFMFPIAVRPLLPLEVQPIFPLPYFSDPDETNFLGPIPLPTHHEPEEEEIEDKEKEPEFMPY